MAAPHVTGAVAVIQSKALAKLGRRLSPAEVRDVLVRSAAPMTKADLFYDWPCDDVFFLPCGSPSAGMTGEPYRSWQVGAGALDIRDALALVEPAPTKPHKKPKPPKD